MIIIKEIDKMNFPAITKAMACLAQWLVLE